MKKILLLGSGELGKEFVISAKRLGCFVIACDNYAGAPAMQVADECEIFSMLDEAPLRAAIAKHKPDLIVPEIEAIRTEVLLDVEKEGFEVIPSARAANLTMNRDRIRDVAVGLGVRTAKFNYAESSDELMAQAKAIGFPVVIKPVMSSSGKGQSVAKTEADIQASWDYACAGMRGDREGKNPTYSGVSAALLEPGIDVRIFGKPTTRPYRRMAVALAKGDQALQRARAAAAKISVNVT